MYILMGLTAGNAAGYRGGVLILESKTSSYCQRSPLSPFSLVLHFVTVCTYVLGLRFALLQGVAVSMVLTVAAATTASERRYRTSIWSCQVGSTLFAGCVPFSATQLAV